MICIIEGIDGAGKTSLARALSEQTGWPVYKPVGNPLEDGMSTVESQAHDRGAIGVLTSLRGPWGGIIMDRSFPSEYAYSGAFGRAYDDAAVFELDDRVSHVSHLLIHLCFPSVGEGYEIAKSRGMDELSSDQFGRVWSRYADYTFRLTAMRALHINATRKPESALEFAMDNL